MLVLYLDETKALKKISPLFFLDICRIADQNKTFDKPIKKKIRFELSRMG